MDECKQCFVIVIIIVIVIVIISGTHGLTHFGRAMCTPTNIYNTQSLRSFLARNLQHETHKTHEMSVAVCLFVWCCAVNGLGPEGAKPLAPALTMITNMTNLNLASETA